MGSGAPSDGLKKRPLARGRKQVGRVRGRNCHPQNRESKHVGDLEVGHELKGRRLCHRRVRRPAALQGEGSCYPAGAIQASEGWPGRGAPRHAPALWRKAPLLDIQLQSESVRCHGAQAVNRDSFIGCRTRQSAVPGYPGRSRRAAGCRPPAQRCPPASARRGVWPGGW
jgi:hypothetical protein